MEDFRTRIRAVTAEEYWIPSVRVADAFVEGGGTAFMYRLDFTESSGHLSGFAYHSLDVPLVWDRPHPNTATSNEELSLGKQVHLAWAAFIRGESPAAPGLPAMARIQPRQSPDDDSRRQQPHRRQAPTKLSSVSGMECCDLG